MTVRVHDLDLPPHAVGVPREDAAGAILYAAERATWDGSEEQEDPALSELREALHALDREWSGNA